MTLVCLNGSWIHPEEAVIPVNSRAFTYGDGFFETIRVHGSRVLFFGDHWQRMMMAADFFKLELPFGSPEDLLTLLRIAIVRNNLSEARIRLQLWRKEGRFYRSDSAVSEFLISTEPLSDVAYSLNPVGIYLQPFTEITKSRSRISNFKSISSVQYTLASFGLAAATDRLLMNDAGHWIEATASNLFLAVNGEIISPPLSDGCMDGVMRSQVFRLCARSGITYYERSVDTEMLKNADEIFLTNVVAGIRWVEKFENHVYSNQKTIQLLELLNSDLKMD